MTFPAAFIPLGGLILYLLSRRVVKAFHGSVTPVPVFSDFKLPNLAKVTGGGENFLNIEVLTNRVIDGKS